MHSFGRSAPRTVTGITAWGSKAGELHFSFMQRRDKAPHRVQAIGAAFRIRTGGCGRFLRKAGGRVSAVQSTISQRAPSQAAGAWAGSITTGIVLLGVLAALAFGWTHRGQLDLTPETGAGYALGIGGTACMLLLLSYSARKRLRVLRAVGSLKGWFRFHLALGVTGPIAILFHCDFQPGSVNSNVALACALTVASSGVIGRMVYPKIHRSMDGSRITLDALRAELGSQRSRIGVALAPSISAELQDFELGALASGGSWLAAIPRSFSVSRGARQVRQRVRRLLGPAQAGSRTEAQRARESAAACIDTYLDCVCRLTAFRVYERIFSLWHALHLPLCVLLFTAAALHVIAVHAY